MRYRIVVIHLATGETLAAFHLRHYHEAVACALDLAECNGEKFAVAVINSAAPADAELLFTAPEQTQKKNPACEAGSSSGG